MREKLTVRLYMVVFGLCLLLVGSQPLYATTPMPHFSLTDAVSGKMVDSDTFAGKAKLVVFFATWCPPCMQEVPILKQLQEDVQRFMQRSNVNYPVVMADRKVIKDFGGIPGVPVTFLVSKDGNVLRKYPGLVPHKLLEREVKKMLGK
jgi:thiol-disulfide isomerase/thioredoxin